MPVPAARPAAAAPAAARLRAVFAALAAASLLAAASAHAGVRAVPSVYPTVGAALAAAAAGDTVLVAPGTYAPSTNGEAYPLAMNTADVRLLADGPGATLDAEGTSRVITLNATGAARFGGFTVTGGAEVTGGGIYVLSGTPEIDHNVIIGNGASFRGAGIIAVGSTAPWIHHNVIWENFDTNPGDLVDPHAMLFQDSAAGVAEHNLVGRTDGNGLLTMATAQPTVRHNIFLENGQADPVRGRGICWLAATPAIVTHNLFHANELAAILWPASGGDLSGAAANDVDAGDQVYGNLDGDPLLADPDGGDFRLSWGSPAIDAGNPALPPDPDGTVADLGPFYLDQDAVAAPLPGAAAPIALRAAPNPFRARTRIDLGGTGSGTVRILDAAGRRVRTLSSTGSGFAEWDGRDARGRAVAAGVYLVRTGEGDAARTIRVVRLR